jgi:methyl-accepting chemotaxis protein
MAWTFGGKREIRSLHRYVNDNEVVAFIAQGTYHERQGIVVLTNERLLFVYDGWLSQQLEDFPLEQITAVATKAGLSSGDLTVRTGGAGETIKSIINSDLHALTDRLRSLIGGSERQLQASTPQQSAPSNPSTNEVLEQIRRLGELHDAGILTNEEFQAKKAELLARL